MSTSEKREIAVPKYFIKSPDKPSYIGSILLICLGGVGIVGVFLLIIISSLNNTGYNQFGSMISGVLCCSAPFFAVIIVGIFMYLGQKSIYDQALKKAEPKPSDEQMDNWKKSDLERIRKESLKKLDLEALAEQVVTVSNGPIIVVGPSANTHIALGKDNIIRFSIYDVVIVYLTDYHLAAYSCTINMATGLETKESTQEYHYQDVVSVATQADNSSLFKIVHNGKDKPLANYQKFSLSVASGEKIEVVISLPQADDLIKNGSLAPTGAENAVKLIRSRLREKKGGIQE